MLRKEEPSLARLVDGGILIFFGDKKRTIVSCKIAKYLNDPKITPHVFFKKKKIGSLILIHRSTIKGKAITKDIGHLVKPCTDDYELMWSRDFLNFF